MYDSVTPYLANRRESYPLAWLRRTLRWVAGLGMLWLLAACARSGTEPGTPPPLPSRTVFPADNPWNRDVSQDPVDPASDSLIASCGATHELHPDFGTVYDGAPWGIPFVTVSGTQARVPVSFTFADESDPGPYPIPPSAPIEGGPSGTGDRHVLVVDDISRCREVYSEFLRQHGMRPTAAANGAAALAEMVCAS